MGFAIGPGSGIKGLEDNTLATVRAFHFCREAGAKYVSYLADLHMY
jgi:hypothetical protein